MVAGARAAGRFLPRLRPGSHARPAAATAGRTPVAGPGCAPAALAVAVLPFARARSFVPGRVLRSSPWRRDHERRRALPIVGGACPRRAGGALARSPLARPAGPDPVADVTPVHDPRSSLRDPR